MLEESDFVVVKACYPAFALRNLADYCSSTSLIEVNGISGIREYWFRQKSLQKIRTEIAGVQIFFNKEGKCISE